MSSGAGRPASRKRGFLRVTRAGAPDTTGHRQAQVFDALETISSAPAAHEPNIADEFRERRAGTAIASMRFFSQGPHADRETLHHPSSREAL